MKLVRSIKLVSLLAICLLAMLSIAVVGIRHACAADPIKIGLGMAQSGAYAGNGKAALLAIQMWVDETNAKGGLIGRPIQLIYYDDQSSPAQVPAIYQKLLDIDKVDLLLTGYGTNVIAASIPTIMRSKKVAMAIFGLAANDKFKYDRYFQVQPNGPQARLTFSQGFFETAMTMDPKPKTVAILATDSEFPNTASEGAREWAKKFDLKIVYDKTFPPSTVDFSPVMRAVQATNPDIVYVTCFPPDTVGIVKTINEFKYFPRMIGGGMVGPQYASIKSQLGPLLNRITTFEAYVPEPTLKFPGINDFLGRYQAKAAAAGVDGLGFYIPPYIYAGMQMLGSAVEDTKGLDHDKLADYLHKTTHKTIVGDIKYGADGEWEKERTLFVQYQNIVGNDAEQFKQAGKQVILFPPEYKSGNLLHPYGADKQ